MKENLTQPIQDYLKHIYALSEAGTPATTTDLAARLGVAPASVTGMIQRLAGLQPPLVTYRKHQGALLTPAGKRAALEVIRHHRLLETYLVTMLGFSWDEVHEEACRLEHVISETFEERIASALGNPTHDPHGDPIPSAALEMPTDESTPLLGLRPPHSAVIMRVQATDPPFLRHLNNLGLIPGARVQALAFSPFDQNLQVRVNEGEAQIIGAAISAKIYVEEKG